MRALQDILGEMNDIEVQRALLRRLRAEGAVRERLASRERVLTAALEPAWKKFESRRLFWRPRPAARAKE